MPARRKVNACIVFSLGLLAAGAIAAADVLESLDLWLLDRQFSFLRRYKPEPLGRDVVLVGIDEASFARLHEPFALWHPHLGKFLQAMAVARPSVLGVDIALPERSYHFIAPQYDLPLLKGLLAIKPASPVVIARTLDENGALRPVFPPYVSVAGLDAFGSVAVCLDRDGIVRRLFGNRGACPEQDPLETLSGKMAERAGIRPACGEIIDFAVGGPYRFIPFLEVLDWFDRNERERLVSVFGGRPVFLGINLPYTDRHRVPVSILESEPGNRRLPGVLVHAQAFRSFMHHGLLRRAGLPLVVLTALPGAFFWFGRGGKVKTALFVSFMAATPALSTLALSLGTFFPAAAAVASATVAFTARISFEGVRTLREKLFLRRSFGSYVSPEVLQEILAGRIRPGLGGSRMQVCVLFSDIRGFTTRSEAMAPEAVIAMLNDYFSAMTAAIHRHGGTVDKFIGDGIMALFGAPQALDSPEKAALATAREMLARLEEVNHALGLRGLEPIRIGIGIHSGEAVVGHVGSATRHEYTAIGDVVNVASRLEGLTKDLGHAIVCSEAVALSAGDDPCLLEVGEHPIRGHSVMRLFACAARGLEHGPASTGAAGEPTRE